MGLEGKIVFFLYLLLVLSCCTVSQRHSVVHRGEHRVWPQKSACPG